MTFNVTCHRQSPAIAHRFFLVGISVVGCFIRRDVCCHINWLMDHFSPDLRNSQTESIRFVTLTRRILTSSVHYLSWQHMVLPPQTVTVSRQTTTTSVVRTTHYILAGEEHCLAETGWVQRVQRRSSQN